MLNSIDASTSSYPQGLISPQKKSKRFPHTLAVAITSLTTSALLNALSQAAKSILAFLIRLAKATSPTAPSWAFKSTIASELGMHPSTVYRGLKELEKAELIERLPQLRNKTNNRFSYGKICLTEKACQHLLNTTPVIHTPSSKMRHAYECNLKTKEQSKETVSEQAVNKNNSPVDNSVLTSNRRVPKELVWLITPSRPPDSRIFYA